VSQAAAVSPGARGEAGKARAAPAPARPAAALSTSTALAVPAYLQARFNAGAPVVQRAPDPAVPEEEALPAEPGLQAKVAIGPPDDPYERDADAVAVQVQRRAAAPVAVQQAPLPEQEPLAVQRLALADKEPLPVQRLALPEETSLPVQRKAGAACPTCAASDDRLQAKPAGEGGAAAAIAPGPRAAPALHRALAQPGPGAPLAPSIRGPIEPVLGADLGGVRVHADAGAAAATRAIQARAFTHGEHIWLGPGESAHDLGLMAHESTHVVQQGAAGAPRPSGEAGGGGGAAGRVAGGSVSAPAAEGGGATGDGLLMPEPREGLSAVDHARLAEVGAAAEGAAEAYQTLPPAEQGVAQAQGAVTVPAEETAARAEAALAAELGARPEPSAEIEALCARILEVIHSRQPPDEASLIESDPQEEAEAAGAILEGAVEGDAERVSGDYAALGEEPPAMQAPAPESIEAPPESVDAPAIGAAGAAPDPIEVEGALDADVEANAERIREAGMESEPAQEAARTGEGPIAEAMEAQGELTETAARDPAEVMAEQAAASESAASDMAALQARALESLQTGRSGTIGGVGGQQQAMVGSEEQMRAQVSAQAQRIFDSAREQVEGLLEPLPDLAMRRWQTGVQVVSTRFDNDLAEVQRWLDERYSGVGGALTELADDFFGKPAWVTQAYNRAEERFAAGVCDLIREISTEVNGIIATCERLIDDADREIATLFDGLPESLRDWAEGERARMQESLDGLTARAHAARDDLTSNLTREAASTVQQARERVQALREAAKGLVGRIADAVAAFAEDPAKFIIEGLLKIVGIAPSAFWALVNRIGQVIEDIADDPVNFADNLALALKQGFQRFFDNFGTHILGGFFDWLFSGLGSVGVEIPSDFSLGSLITFFLQLMGITWARIRQILARHIGEENVALLERAYELIALLMEQGVDGIFELIKEQLNPQTLLDAILSAAVDLLIDMLIRAVTPQVLLMFIPGAVIIQAIRVIYRILAWVFNNAARIFSLVETVVNGAADLIAGNTAGMATAVEAGLARLIAPVIDFLAGLLYLGNLPDQIARAIGGFQDMVLAAIERVVGVIAQRARGLLGALGLGGATDAQAPDPSDHDALATRARDEMQQPEPSADDYGSLRVAKEAQARDIESRYSRGLESGIGLRVIFVAASADAGDSDLDFTIEIAPNTTTKAGSVAVGPHDNDLVNIDSFGRRPKFRSSTREELPVESGEHRRHIGAWEAMHVRLKQVLNGKTVAQAAALLERMGTLPQSSYTVDPRDVNGVKQAGYRYLLDKHNDESNLWVGEGSENSSLGSRSRWARVRARDAVERCDRAAFDANIAELEVTWHDPDPSGEKAGFRNEVIMAIRVLRREFNTRCPNA
jgi:hypothetical protein